MPKGRGNYSGMSSKSQWSGSVDSYYRRRKAQRARIKDSIKERKKKKPESRKRKMRKY